MLSFILKNYQDNNKNDQHVLSYNEPELCNEYISKEYSRNNQFPINIPRHCVLGHNLTDIEPLDAVEKKVVRPTKKPRSVDPRKLDQ